MNRSPYILYKISGIKIMLNFDKVCGILTKYFINSKKILLNIVDKKQKI